MRRTGHKFNAQRTEVDGISFASKAEARRYSELLLLAKAGKIECLELQPVFHLSVSRGALVGGEVIGKYVADFRYYDMDSGRDVVEDVKGFKTELYRWKKKHVEAQYGIEIVEIGRKAGNGKPISKKRAVRFGAKRKTYTRKSVTVSR
jgi:hypothetical protein